MRKGHSIHTGQAAVDRSLVHSLMYSLGHGLSPALVVTKQRSESKVCKVKCLRESRKSQVSRILIHFKTVLLRYLSGHAKGHYSAER
jgi:hypothetical protein